jgi:hypothetical protein
MSLLDSGSGEPARCPTRNPRLALTVEQLAHIENRPALSRWHPDYAEAFTAYVKGR